MHCLGLLRAGAPGASAEAAARRALFRDNALRVYRIDPAALRAPA